MKTHMVRRSVALRMLLQMSALLATSGMALAGGEVLSPDRSPYGYTLDRLAREMAYMDITANQFGYPATPFQILYVIPGHGSGIVTNNCVNGQAGYYFADQEKFYVTEGVAYFVPLWSANDLPPVIGQFPSRKSQAAAYFFGSDLNAWGARIIVDGHVTQVGPRFVGSVVGAGGTLDTLYTPEPYYSAWYPDSPTFHLIQLGVFVAPLARGVHTVRIRGQLGNSQAFYDATGGLWCQEEDITYTVVVLAKLSI
jgi:hypothetical protein